MQIKKLHIKNLASHKETTFDLDKLTVFRAMNAAGKSTIAQAISLMLAGRSESTDDRGSGAKELIRKGEDKALVGAQMLIDGNERHLRMSITEKSGRTLAVKNPKDDSYSGSELIDYFRINRDVLSCLCNGHYFIDMDEAKQKDFLAGIVLPKSMAWDASVVADCNDVEISVAWSLPPFEIIERAYNSFYAERATINRAIKSWTAPEKPAESTLKIEDIRAKLAERQSQRTALALQRQGLLDGYERDLKASVRLAKRKADLESKLATIEQAQRATATLILTDKQLKAHQKIAGQAEQGKLLDAQIVSITTAQAANEDRIAKLMDLSAMPCCPTCQQNITEEMVSEIGQPLILERDKMARELFQAIDKRKALGDFEAAKKAITAHEQALRDQKNIQAAIDQIGEELNTIPDASAITVPDTTAIDVQIVDIDQRIAKGNAALYEAGQVDEKRKACERALAEKKALDEKLVLLEKLVEYFGPNGIKAKLLDEHVGGFCRKMNDALGKWGYSVHMSFEPYRLGVQFFGADHIYSLRTLSESQRYRFATAFQLALAQVTCIGFCVIDGADILDGPSRQQLFRALAEAQLEQVIVLATDERNEVPHAPGRAFYRISMALEVGIPTSKVEKL